MKRLLPLLLLAAFAAPDVRAADVDLTQGMVRRNELFLATQAIRPYLYDDDVLDRLASWLHHDKIRPYVADCNFHMKAFFRSEKILGPLCYLLRQDDSARRALATAFVDRSVLETEAALHELSGDPRYAESDRKKAATWAAHFTAANKDRIRTCLKPALEANYPSDGSLPFTPFSGVASCFHGLPRVSGSPFFAGNLEKEFKNHPGHALNEAGWTRGNKVTYVTKNDTSVELARKLDERHEQMKERYPLGGAGSFEAMKGKDWRQTFTAEEGFWTVEEHPIWNQTEGIFPEMLRMVREAKETIFVDMFFLGSSMGAIFAKELIAKAEGGVKVFVLRDNHNHFGHEPEMLPVFNYLQAYSFKNPGKLVVAASYIKGHRTGLPKFVDRIVTDEFLKQSGLQAHLSLYGRAVSDHSKIFAVDAKTKRPVALVGSKNLTDASGGVTYDDVTRIEGPAAALVQDDYYFDMALALRHEMDEAMLKHLAAKGWSKDSFQAGQGKEQWIANVLRPFDLLGRDSAMKASATAKVSVPEVGDAVLRTGYNNVDSSRTNCVDQVLQMILHAKTNIYIRDQFLFDRNVVLALVKARKKTPALDVKILLEPLDRANPRGLPNLLYLDVLKAHGMQIRWKKLIEATGHIHAEYHMKTISADGESLIMGSANKDQTTMYGSFREQQIDVFDKGAVRVHDEVMLRHWESDEESRPFTSFDFEVPFALKGSDGKPLDPKRFVGLVRNVVSLLYDTTGR